jgi:hypothetical protein
MDLQESGPHQTLSKNLLLLLLHGLGPENSTGILISQTICLSEVELIILRTHRLSSVVLSTGLCLTIFYDYDHAVL